MKKIYQEPMLIQHVYADICASTVSIPNEWDNVIKGEDDNYT